MADVSNKKRDRNKRLPPPVRFSSDGMADLPCALLFDVSTTTTQRQIDFVKSLAAVEGDKVLKVLIRVYLQSPSKHPLKNISSKLLLQRKRKNPTLESILYGELLSSMLRDGSLDCRSLNDVCNSLVGCLDLFPSELTDNRDVQIETLQFLKYTLQTHINHIEMDSSNLSPTEKMDIYTYIHNTNRLLIPILQKFYAASSNLNESIDWKKVIHNLAFLLSLEDLHMDAKTNSCIILILILKHEVDVNLWKSLLKFAFDAENCNDTTIFEEMNLKTDAIFKLGVCVSVINVIDIDALTSGIIDEIPALNFISKNLIKLCDESSVHTTVVLGITRTFLVLSKMLYNIEISTANEICDIILLFVWQYLDYYVDSVRHLTYQILINTVKYISHLRIKGDSKLSDKLFDQVLHKNKNQYNYYKSLVALGSEFSCSLLLEHNPHLVENMITSINEFSDASIVSTTFETFMAKQQKELSYEELYSTWVFPVINKLVMYEYKKENEATSQSFILTIMREILYKAVKIDSKIVELMISHILPDEDLTKGHLTEGHFKCILLCLGVVRKTGHFDHYVYLHNAVNKSWKGVISFDILNLAMTHQMAEISVLAFNLITDSLKSTEPFIHQEFQLIETFFEYNINNKQANIRQEILSVTKKFLDRWLGSYLKMSKDPTEYNFFYKVSLEGEELLKLHQKFLLHYENFLKKLKHKLLENIFPGANYGRRNMSMQIFLWCLDVIEKCKTTITNQFVSDNIEKKTVKLLYDVLDDSYEYNKQLAVCILSTSLTETFFNSISIDLLKNYAIEKASSVKPTDCVSSAYKLELYIKLSSSNDSCLYDTHYSVISELLKSLNSEIKYAKENILNGAGKGPMYGLVYCIRHILNKVDLSSILINQKHKWESLIDNIINICFEINMIVSPIVNNSSPEGHLPMDFHAGSYHMQDRGIQIDNGTVVTAQMVLLCGWRSVKEVSLLLGDLSNKMCPAEEETLNANEEKTPSTMKRNLIAIGDHFITLLSETKHRGAFEQAYVGFTKLCFRLWGCNSKELHCLPSMWLNDLINTIASGDSENSKLCATRRSAGVPFIIQALVITELQVNSSPQTFEKCMNTLLNLAKRKHDTTVETRTHCLNILRALYRHTALSQYVNPFIADGLILSITGFEGATWAERNSSTLLFSSLITRIFGVQRTKDSETLCIRNKMTGRIFFLRYPALYDFLLDYLKRYNISDKMNVMKPSLYPVLLLLSRLYPSLLEGTDSNLQLVAFLPYLVLCSGSCVLKIRQLAAKATIPLIHPDRYYNHIVFYFNLLIKNKGNSNFCHGILLQIQKLLQFIPENTKLSYGGASEIIQYIKNCDWILKSVFSDDYPCFVICEAYLQIILLFLKSFHNFIDFSDDFLVVLRQKLDHSRNFYNKHLISLGKDQFFIQALHLNFYLSTTIPSGSVSTRIAELILNHLAHSSNKLIEITLNYLTTIYIECFEFHKVDIGYEFEEILRTNLTNDEMKDVLDILHKNQTYHRCIMQFCESTKKYQHDDIVHNILLCMSKMVTEVSYLKAFDPINILNQLSNGPPNKRHVYIRYLDEFFTSNKIESLYENFTGNQIDELNRILLKSSTPESEEKEKLAVANLFLNHWKMFKWEQMNGDRFVDKIVNLMTLMNLLNDESSTITTKICTLTQSIMLHQNKDTHTNQSLNENLARETLLNMFLTWMQRDFSKISAGLIILALGDTHTNNSDDDEISVFDKGELGNNEEECVLTLLSMRRLKNISKVEHFKSETANWMAGESSDILRIHTFLKSNKYLTLARENLKNVNVDGLIESILNYSPDKDINLKEIQGIDEFKIITIIETLKDVFGEFK